MRSNFQCSFAIHTFILCITLFGYVKYGRLFRKQVTQLVSYLFVLTYSIPIDVLGVFHSNHDFVLIQNNSKFNSFLFLGPLF